MRDLRVITIPTPDGQDISGWQCSDCEWRFSVHLLANEVDRRLVLKEFHAHDCAAYPPNAQSQAAGSSNQT
jgi:hypothetical protein